MRIMIITDQYPPEYFGGMAQHAAHMAQFLSKNNEVLVLLPYSNKVQGSDKISIVSALTLRLPRLDAIIALMIAAKYKPDSIHVCNAGMAYRIISKFYPVVLRVVGNDFLYPWSGPGLIMRSLLYRVPFNSMKSSLEKYELIIRKKNIIKQLKKCTAVVANSSWTKQKLLEEGISDEIVDVVVGGMNEKLFVPPGNNHNLRCELNIQKNDIIIITASNLIKIKGIDTVIRAVYQLKEEFRNIKYYVLGQGVEFNELKKMVADLDLEKNVLFLGKKTQSELCKYYQASDVYVQISRRETMGRTYFEAGGCGIPVIASRVGGIPSVVIHEQNGLLVDDPDNVEEVVKNIRKLLKNKSLSKKLGNEGIRLAKDKYSWKIVGKRFEDIIKNSVEKKKIH